MSKTKPTRMDPAGMDGTLTTYYAEYEGDNHGQQRDFMTAQGALEHFGNSKLLVVYREGNEKKNEPEMVIIWEKDK